MTEPTSEILLFQVGARVFAAPVHDVRRIGSTRDAGELVADSVLGAPFGSAHGLIVETREDHLEHTLVVDGVVGIRSVPETDVQPLPAFAAVCLQSGAVKGYVLIDDAPTLLIDLPTLMREELAHHLPAAAPAPAAATERS